MSFHKYFAFSALEMSVRYGDGNTNNNDIISCYVHMGLERGKNLSDITAVRHAYMRVINTLIDTMCDHCLTCLAYTMLSLHKTSFTAVIRNVRPKAIQAKDPRNPNFTRLFL
jgi:hypothetical protein